VRGRPPKSIEQRRAEDNFNTTRHSRVPMLVKGRYTPRCPRHLSGDARKAYRTLIDDLWDSQYLDGGDRLLVASAAMLHSVAMSAQETVDSLGPVYSVTRGARYGTAGYKVMEANPAVRLRRDFLAEFRQCCELLGVGPGSRARLEDLGIKRHDGSPRLVTAADYEAWIDQYRTPVPIGESAHVRPSPPKPSAPPGDGRKRPRCPKSLAGNAKIAWGLLMDDLWDSGIMEVADRGALEAAAMHYGSAMAALELIERHGVIYPVTRGARDGNPGYRVLEANPATRMLRDSLAEFRQCCDLLGIGPSARARLRHLGMMGRSPIGIIAGLSTKPSVITYDPEAGERIVDRA
jgi:P27 family predicted phage terminase small subunit